MDNTVKLNLPITKTHNTQFTYNVLHNVEPTHIDYSYGVSQKYGLTLSRGFSYMPISVVIPSQIVFDAYTKIPPQTIDLAKSYIYDIKPINGLYYITAKASLQLIVNNVLTVVDSNIIISTCNFCDFKFVDMYCNCDKIYDYGCEQVFSQGTNEIITSTSIVPKEFNVAFSNAVNYKVGSTEYKKGYSSSVDIGDFVSVNIGDDFMFYQSFEDNINNGIIMKVVGKKNTATGVTIYFANNITGKNIEGGYGEGIISDELQEHINVNTCNGIQNYTKNGVITNPTFKGCYKNIKTYQGANGGQYLLGFNEDSAALVISSQGNQYIHGDAQSIASGTRGIAVFGNFILYGSNSFIGASYIGQNGNIPFLYGNIIKNNVGFHINPDGKLESYTQYNDSFYFLGDTGSNRRIYSASLSVNNAGYINSAIKDMSDEIWLTEKEKELDQITPNDYVYMQANDTQFNIIINYSDNHDGNPEHTKILTYWKDYKIRTTRKICNAVISRVIYYKGNEVWYGPDGMYRRCGLKDTIRYRNIDGTYTDKFQQILANINVCLFDDGHRVHGGIEGRNSYTTHDIKRVITQLSGRYTKAFGLINLNLNAYDNLRRQKAFDGFSNNAMLDRYATNNKEEYTMSKCLLDQLDSCESYHDDEIYNPIDTYFDTAEDCFCPKRKNYMDLCVNTNTYKKYLSPIVNIHSPINMKSNVFDLSLQFTEDITFYGRLVEYINNGIDSIDKVSDCAIVGYNNCVKQEQYCHDNTNAILCK